MKKYFILVSAVIGFSPIAYAQSFMVPSAEDGRAEKWDLTLQLTTNQSDTYDGDQGTSIRLSQRTGFGFGAAYNFNDHLALGFDMNFISPRYTATIQPQTPGAAPLVIDHRADITTGQLKGTWNILKSNFTPYIDIGGGFTFIDSNVVDTEVPSVCWWDPWYGPICSTSSYSDTNFSYGGAAGLRWDIKNNIVLKASINTLEVDTTNNPRINSVRFEIGARY